MLYVGSYYCILVTLRCTRIYLFIHSTIFAPDGHRDWSIRYLRLNTRMLNVFDETICVLRRLAHLNGIGFLDLFENRKVQYT